MRRNKYGLDQDALEKILKDQNFKCIYCGEKMHDPSKSENRMTWATIEHLHRIGPPWNIITWVAWCCGSCNFSRGNRKLRDWIKTAPRCIEKSITEKSVATVVRRYLETPDSHL